MGVDRAGADNELRGHLVIREPLDHQAQHLHFSGGQSAGEVGDGFAVGVAGCPARVSTCSGVIVRPCAHAAA